MNRVVFSLTALLGALMPLVFDSALKGAVLLGIAAFCALLLHRASPATRHLVWLVAIVALLVVPVLSVTLPQWRVLPGWAVVRPLTASSGEVRDRVPPAAATRGVGAVVVPPLTGTLPANPSPSAGPPVQAVSSAPSVASDPVRTWHDWLAPVWGVGFTFLALRLLAAHLLLRCAMRDCSVVRATSGNAETDGLAAQLEAACAQLGIRQRVTLLLDDRRTIPVVWGVFRPRLLLPAEALEWSDEQVRSVLLHELAHIQRRDTLVQWLTQIACALHWWNPLVWLAAWRLHAERERACDDLVLVSGVRPSAYAEHLLHVATKLSPARWTAACGLAMARNSSLEGRLLAVLSQKLNRRGTSRALAATTLAIGTLIAIPLAMLRAADEGEPVTRVKGLAWNAPQDGPSLGYRITGDEWRILGKKAKLTPDALLGAWRGTVNQERLMVSFHRPPAEQDVQCDIYFGEATIGALARFVIADDGGSAEVIQHSVGGGMKFGTLLPIEPGKLKLELYGRQKGQQEVILVRVPEGAATEPRQEGPRELFKIWKATANEDGTIPGAFIGALASEVQAYVKANPTRSSAMDLPKLLPRFVTSRNWTEAEAIQLLDDVAYHAPALPFTRAGTAAKATEAKPGPGPAMLPENPSVPGSFPAEE